MIRYLGALAKDRDSVAAMLIYGFAGRLIYGFAIFHNGITTAIAADPRKTKQCSNKSL